MKRTVAILVLAGAGVACDRQAVPPAQAASSNGTVRVTELATDLVHPWGLAFLPDQRMLVTERPGRLLLLAADGTVIAPIAGVPKVYAKSQAGLLDVAISPKFAADGLVYLSYAEPDADGKAAGTSVLRGRLADNALHDVQVVYRQEPKLSTGIHTGSRLVFDDAGHLFVAQGENNQRPTSQELDKLQGKLVRINPDSSVPVDNPFVGKAGVRPEIWSYGHRNMQGAALHPVTRRLWTSEHGPRGGDEVNIPEAGKNYGWPVITYGINYSGLAIPEAKGTSAPGLEQPHHWWKVSPGLSGMTFYSADRIPAWKQSLFLGSLAQACLIRLQLDGDKVVGEERLLADRGERIRDVRQGPDGRLYVLTDAPKGKLLRLEI